MGQKSNPIGMRLGIVNTWDSRWFARKDYAKLLEEDLFIRKYLKRRLSQAGISKIVIQRAVSKVTVNISTARPGLVIQAARDQEARHQGERVEAGTPDLALSLRLGQVRRHGQHERHGAERVDDRQDRQDGPRRVAQIRREPVHVRTLAGR